jgi:DNA-binding NarL/FixJ family response regulator
MLVDDHEMVRQGLCCLIKRDAQLEVVGVAGDGYNALELATQLKPDIALVDISMPAMDGIELCRRLMVKAPSLAVLMLTAISDARLVADCIRVGARGYILKDVDHLRLNAIIKTLTLGGSFIDPRILSQLAYKSGSDYGRSDHDLSAQQIAILKHISKGFSNKEIGTTLCLSENTVKSYVQELLHKLDARNRAEAAMIALRNGWI